MLHFITKLQRGQNIELKYFGPDPDPVVFTSVSSGLSALDLFTLSLLGISEQFNSDSSTLSPSYHILQTLSVEIA